MKNFNSRKAQAAIDLISSYGWVILVGIGAVAVLSNMGTFSTVSCEKSRFGFSQVVPADWAIYVDSDAALLYVTNWAGDPVQITATNLSLDNGVDCSLASTVVLEPGDTAFLVLDCQGSLFGEKKYGVGDCFIGRLQFDYINQRSQNHDTSKGKIRGSMDKSVVTTTTTTTTTTSTTSTTMCSANTDCPLCQKCVSGFCADQSASEDLKTECSGSFGACAGDLCNGAGACSFLVPGKQLCGVCQYCSGSAYLCSNVSMGADTYSDCPLTWTGCSGNCVKTGSDGNCNGAGACDLGGRTANVAAGNVCSAGSEAAGACNGAWACTTVLNTDNAYGNNPSGQYYTQGFCDGSGSCDSSGGNGNHCNDTIRDCDETGVDSGGSCVACFVNGTACSGGSDCCSGNCKADYDGIGTWCADAGDCVHNAVIYPNGGTAPDCGNVNSSMLCNTGTWINSSCGTDVCSGTCGTGVNSCIWADYSCSLGSCGSISYDVDTSQSRCDGCRGAGYWSLGGEVAGAACCGDDSGEYKRNESQGTDAPSAFSHGTVACCNSTAKCVEAGVCYNDTQTTGSIPNKGYCNAGTWQGGDAGNTQCDAIAGAGRWFVGGEVAGASCCGDDSGENYRTRLVDATLHNGYASNPSDNGCCDSATDCLDADTCYSSGYASKDVDANGNNDYCNAGTWADCNTNAECGGATPYCVGGDCVQCTADAQCGLCQKCSGGTCISQLNGEDLKNECPGAFGTCAGASCNGAGACQYLAAGKQGCGTCQYCTGSSFSCSNMALGSDTYGDCPGAFGTCADTNCNGAGACSYLAAGKQGCGTCQGCTGASFACAQVSAGSDTYNECPGAFGTCAGANCNGASACQYLAVGKQGCGTCQYCTGSSFACSNMGAGSDAYNDCPGAFGTCADTNCNGAGACSYLASGKQGCGTCQGCTGAGFACAQISAGSDTYNECPGAFGTCAGLNCNGASACQYLAAGQQGCGACKYCTGAAFPCSNVAAATDPYNACSSSYNGCSSGSCVKTGPDGNCDGSGSCNAGGLSTNVAQGNVCSGGTESAGVCNAAYACTNAVNTNGAYNNAASPFWTQGYCTGAGACMRSGANLADGDGSSAACQCIRAASGYWNIGGEVAGTTCCGDDAGENKRTRVCSSGCTTDATDDGCCDTATDCVYSSTCYANAALYSTYKCNAGTWTTTTVATPTTAAPVCTRSVTAGVSGTGESCPSSCSWYCTYGVCCTGMMQCGSGTKCWDSGKSRQYTGSCGTNKNYQVCYMDTWYADMCMPCTTTADCTLAGGISCENGYCCNPSGCGYNCGCYSTGDIVLKADSHYYRCNMNVWDLYL